MESVLVAQDESRSGIGDKAGKRKREKSLKTSAVGSPSASPARSPDDESEVKRMMIHDHVERFIRDKFDTRKFNEVMDLIETGEGHYKENVRLVIQAKSEMRKRGQTVTDYFFTGLNAEELKASPLYKIGLTCRDIFNIKWYLMTKGLPDVTYDACVRAIKEKSLYGAFIRAHSRAGGQSFIKVLENMKKANVPLGTLAVLATRTSYLDVPDLVVPAQLDDYI